MANEKINLLLEAQDNASAKLKNVRGEIDQVGKQATATANKAKNLTGSFGNVGRSAGQAGIQVQQLVGQVQGGVSPFVALSQQAADLGIVLGAPLIGVIVALGASLAQVLLPSLLATTKSFSDLAKEIKATGLDITDLPVEIVEAETKRLKESVEDATTAFQDNEEAIKKAKDRLAEEVRILEKAGIAQEDITRQTIAYRSEVERLIEKVPALTSEVILSQARLNQFTNEVNKNGSSLRDWYKDLEEAEVKTTKFLRALPAGTMVPFALDTDPVQDITNIWEETDKATKSFQELEAQTEMTAMTLKDVGKTGIQSMEDSLVDLINGTKSAKDAFKSMATSIINDMIRMMIQRQITAPLMNAMMGGISGGTYTTVGTGGGSGGADQISFAGGGYTGSGSRSGGVDGKGGFPAILHPNETVIDHAQGQSASSPVSVTLNISTGVSQTVRAEIQNLLPQITSATKAAVADARQRGGGYSRALVGA